MSKYVAESINQSGSVSIRQLHTKCLLDEGLRTWPKCPAISCYCLLRICSSRSIHQLSQRTNVPVQHHRNKTNLLKKTQLINTYTRSLLLIIMCGMHFVCVGWGCKGEYTNTIAELNTYTYFETGTVPTNGSNVPTGPSTICGQVAVSTTP